MARFCSSSAPMSTFLAVVVLLSVSLTSVAGSASEPQAAGVFIREHWYEPGLEQGNPRFDGRFRVNAPEVVVDPRFMYRSEVRENAMMLIRIEEDLARLTGAALYLELWGGHPGSGEPTDIARAELHVVLWDGGAGSVEDYFTLNGEPLDVTGGGHHDVLYRVVSLEPTRLRQGPNRIELLSDTEHHGVEVLLPGPAIVVRTRDTEGGDTP